LRAVQPPVDSEGVGAALSDWVAQGVIDLGTHGELLGRLTVLANRPPTDDHLWTQLVEAVRRTEADDANPWFVDVDRARRDLILSWLTRPGSEIDAASGLPRAMLESGADLSEIEQRCAKLIAAGRAEA
jgi:hypothetical protein